MKIWRGLALLTMGVVLFVWGLHSEYVFGQDSPDPQEGNWVGTAVYGPEEQPTEVEMAFVVEEGLVVHGAVQLLFAFPEMPEEMVNAMLDGGCIARFEDITLTTSSVTGVFTAEDAATGAFSIQACDLGDFGVQLLTEPLTGMWEATPGEPTNMALIEQPVTLATATTQLSAAELFEFRCSECHGLGGEGTAEAPPLNDFPVLPIDFVTSRVRNGPETMSAFSEDEITPEQLELIIEHVQTTIVGSDIPEFSAADLETGRELWIEFCTECHGSLGQGKNDFGPPLNIWPPYSVTGVIEGARIPLPAMPRLSVTDEELVLIAGYMQSWSEENE